jgi:endonuclease YncB( thermonuclease family)
MREKNMNRTLLSKSFLALVALAFLASCTGQTISSSTSLSSSESASSSSSSVSSSESTSSSVTCDTTDYVAQTHLELDYTGHVFLTEGIGPVALKENVDGDTVHFYEKDASGATTSTIVKARFLCIDTPESTGQIEPWGKAASKFTAAQINAAKTIVLSSDYTNYSHAALADSTGSRYLSYVWISEEENAPIADLKLLNLYIVQEGFSTTKSATTSIYYDFFYAADQEAQCLELHIWSGDDPDYIYTTGVTTTLQLIDERLYYDEDAGDYVDYDWTDTTHNKVAFDCYIAMTYNGNAYAYMDAADLNDPSLTTRYGIYIFAGYRNISPLTHVGWELNVVGYVTTFNGNLQLTGVNYSALYHDDDDITVLDKTGSAYTAPVLAPETASSDAYMNVVVTVNNLHGVTGYGTYADSDGSAFTVKCYDSDNSNYIYLRFELGVVYDRNDITQIINESTFESYFCTSGETFNVTAPVQRYESSSGNVTYQLVLCHNAELVFNS